MSVQSKKPQGKSVSKTFHDWLLGEDSALRAFLPSSLSGCSPQPDAPASVDHRLPLGAWTYRAEAGAPIPIHGLARRHGKTGGTIAWMMQNLEDSARCYVTSVGRELPRDEAIKAIRNPVQYKRDNP